MRATLIAISLALAACGGADFDEPVEAQPVKVEQKPQPDPPVVRVQKP